MGRRGETVWLRGAERERSEGLRESKDGEEQVQLLQVAANNCYFT